jgi:hypothetical protein
MGLFRKKQNVVVIGVPDKGPFANLPSIDVLVPGDPALEPIAGIDLRRYATVTKAVDDLGEPDPVEVSAVLAEHGVTTEAWADAAAGWPRRIARNRALSALYSQVFNAVG